MKFLIADTFRASLGRLTGNPSRPFEKPKSGRIAVKVINHVSDEVMKVF